MGNIFRPLTELPNEGTITGPSFRSPLTDIVSPLLHHDMGPCVTFNGNYYNCLEAYGDVRGAKMCKNYFQDLMECAHMQKQERRVQAMMIVRWRKYVEGQLGLGPKVPRYAEPPPMDSYAPMDLHYTS